MSRKNRKNSVPSPVQYFLTWNSGEGGVRIYDKDSKNTVLAKKIKFLIVDMKYGVTGYVEKSNTYINSTEVSNVREEKITVYEKGKVIGEDYWGNLKEENEHFDFTVHLYISFQTQ